MKRNSVVMILLLLIPAFCLGPGCGSRPGFEGEFAEMPPPDPPQSGLTDEEIEEARDREAEEKKLQLKELRQETFDLYVDTDRKIEFFDAREEYVLNSGDQLRIRFHPQAEMNMSYVVRPDGIISFDLIGEVPVVGLTPGDLQSTLEEMYAVYLRTTSINVVVDEFQSQRLYVLGEVEKPGVVELINPITLTQVITQAGGWKGTARMEEVMIVRKGEDRTPFSFKVNVREMLKSGDVQSDLYMRNHDVVYVPKGRIASAEDFTNRLFGVILPPIDAIWKTALIADYGNKN